MKMKLKNHKITFGVILLIFIIIIATISNFVVTVMNEKVEPNKASAFNFSSGGVQSLGIIFGDQKIVEEWSRRKDRRR